IPPGRLEFRPKIIRRPEPAGKSAKARNQRYRRNLSSSVQRVPKCIAEFQSRSEEHTSELQSLMRISYAVFCLNKKRHQNHILSSHTIQTKQTRYQLQQP